MKLLFLFLMSFQMVHAQNDLTFYHLGAATPQSSSFNASFFPDSRFYISLPVISGFGIDANSAISYDELFTKLPQNDSVKIDVEDVLSHLKPGDRLRTQGTISLFQLGFRVGDNSAFSIFINDRFKTSTYFPRSVLSYFGEGNANFLDQTVYESYLSARGIYFREIGIGYAQKIKGFGGRSIQFGIRGKYLQGIFQAQTNPNAGVALLTNSDNYDLTFTFTDPEIQTAGFSMTSGNSMDYFIQNSNAGFSVDIGFDIELSPKLSVALAANDLGKITWSQDVKRYALENDLINLPEMDLSDLEDAGTFLADTLSYIFSQTESSDSYTTPLNSRYIGSVRYKLLRKSTVTATVLVENEYRDILTKYGVGLTQEIGKFLTVSGTASYGGPSGFDVGGGLMTRLGIMQIYASVDRLGDFLEATDVTQAKSINARVGLNFLFGRNDRTKKEKQKISPFPEEYDLDHIRDISE